MPIRWKISLPDRLVTAVCEDAVSRADIEAYLDGVVVDGAMPYAKIFEIGDAAAHLDDDDMMALGARIQAYANISNEPMGPLAIVAAAHGNYERAQIYGALAAARRPLKIFRNLEAARRWLDTLKGRT